MNHTGSPVSGWRASRGLRADEAQPSAGGARWARSRSSRQLGLDRRAVGGQEHLVPALELPEVEAARRLAGRRSCARCGRPSSSKRARAARIRSRARGGSRTAASRRRAVGGLDEAARRTAAAAGAA